MLLREEPKSKLCLVKSWVADEQWVWHGAVAEVSYLPLIIRNQMMKK